MIKYQNLVIEKFNHDTIMVKGDKVIYFDPFQINMINMPRADIVFITHHHQDHCSADDLEKIIKNDTWLVAPPSCGPILSRFQQDKQWLKPGESGELVGVKIDAVPAYNIDKFRSPGQLFHPKEEGGLGYVIEIDGVKLYFAGDTDNIAELKELEPVDIAFLPVSGTYVMTAKEAADATEVIRSDIFIPMHYGAIVGDKSQAEQFQSMVKNAEVRILD
ncbi:MAG: MBL fold metallo-hydrolase [Candidatus Komeilibacteria bacterium]|nr:MBL fold metallo-hydrolase [Candidatus Komeilibacteria bacterium]